MQSNFGDHKFIEGLRNYLVHYHFDRPVYIWSFDTKSNKSSSKLALKSRDLLYSGFDWMGEARLFLQNNENIDLVILSRTITKDIPRIISFHQKICSIRLSSEKSCYDQYVYMRKKFKHTLKSTVDAGALFNKSTSLLYRSLDKGIVDIAFESAMTDSQIKHILCTLANRYSNLSNSQKIVIEQEVDRLLRKRKKYPNTGAYIEGNTIA